MGSAVFAMVSPSSKPSPDPEQATKQVHPSPTSHRREFAIVDLRQADTFNTERHEGLVEISMEGSRAPITVRGKSG